MTIPDPSPLFGQPEPTPTVHNNFNFPWIPYEIRDLLVGLCETDAKIVVYTTDASEPWMDLRVLAVGSHTVTLGDEDDLRFVMVRLDHIQSVSWNTIDNS